MHDERGRERLRDRARAAGQDHLLSLIDALDESARDRLDRALADVDWRVLERQRELLRRKATGVESSLEPAPSLVKGADPAADAAARAEGERLLREGRVAAFLVAGGQGSRLGFEGPKGLYPATPIRRKPLFRLFAEKLAVLGKRYGRPIPWFVLTSKTNDAATRDAFAEAGYWGLPSEQVQFLVQDMLPALDADGRILLASATEPFLSPNGHGGSLLALRTSKALERMRAAGVEQIFYFQVDNPLVQIADPVFIGYHALAGAEMSTKVVEKAGPDEKVGVVGLIDGRYGVIEYSDLSDDDRQATDENGRLRFRAGNIAVHVIRRDFVESITRDGLDLPLHLARKRIKCIDPASGDAREIEGYKFESFVFDALGRCSESVILEVDRAEEFAPIKNAQGADSPATSRAAQIELFARWLESAAIAIPRDDDGRPRHAIEISPLFADSPEMLGTRDLSGIDVSGEILLEE